jgi:hypothetical protein
MIRPGSCALLLCSLLPAQEQVDAELRSRLGFVGPRIRKVGEGTNMLRLADLDGDGRAEVVVHNGRRGRLEILRAEGDSLVASSESAGGELAGLQFADVDGDRTLDLLALNSRGRLMVRLRGKEPRDLPEIEVGRAAAFDALRAADLDGDGRADAAILVRDGLRILTRIATEPVLSPPDPIQEHRVGSFWLGDVDGDDVLDLVLGTGAERGALRVKRGLGTGSFGAWLMFDAPNLVRVFAGAGHGGKPTLATIQGAHRRVVESVLDRSAAARAPAVAVTSLPERSRKGGLPFVRGDVDNDGDEDLVVADGERARLLFLLEDQGRYSLRIAPCLAAVSSLALADLDQDGKLDLLVTSPEEEALAWKSGALPLDAFPARLPSKDKPVAVVGGKGFALWIARNDKREGQLWRTSAQDGSGFKLESMTGTGRLTTDPVALVLAELDPAPGPELCFVVPGDGLRVLASTPAGGFRLAEAGAGFTQKIEDGQLQCVPAASRPALLVVRDKYARVFRLDERGEPVVLSQDNGPEGAGTLAMGTLLADGSRVFFDRAAFKLWHAPAAGPAVSVDVPDVGAVHLLPAPGGIALLGDRGVVRITLAGGGIALREVRSYEPPEDKTEFYLGHAADLDGSAGNELVLLDDRMHGVHVLGAREGKLRSGLVFPVFELPGNETGGTEPRELGAGDVDGDGRADLVLLCHDRVLVYLAEK